MQHVFTMQYTSLLLKYRKWISTEVFLHSFTCANAGHLEIKKIHHNSFAKVTFQQDNEPYIPGNSLISCTTV